MDRKNLDKLLTQLESEAKLLFWIDHRKGRRKIFDYRTDSGSRL